MALAATFVASSRGEQSTRRARAETAAHGAGVAANEISDVRGRGSDALAIAAHITRSLAVAVAGASAVEAAARLRRDGIHRRSNHEQGNDAENKTRHCWLKE
eukprot:Amastigsp_a508363_1104.p4 type:complete len:102 gc:universal Amastigsp_a508363_1104:316-11(-)